jgi:hypothetical protein
VLEIGKRERRDLAREALEGLEECFDENTVIVGPNYAQ